jgi:hypothetical protein
MIEMSTVSRGEGAQDSKRRGRIEELMERAAVSPQHTTSQDLQVRRSQTGEDLGSAHSGGKLRTLCGMKMHLVSSRTMPKFLGYIASISRRPHHASSNPPLPCRFHP